MTPSERQPGDVAGIVAVQETRLDNVCLRQWAQTLGLQDLLEDALSGRIKPEET